MTKSESLPEFEVLERYPADRAHPAHPADPADPASVPAAPAGGEPRGQADDLDVVVAVLDQQGRFVFVSDSAEQLFGMAVDEIAGSDLFSLFDSVDADDVRLIFDDLVAGRREKVALELRASLADGRELDLRAVAVRRWGSPVDGVVVSVGEADRLTAGLDDGRPGPGTVAPPADDTAERRSAELRREEQFLQVLLDTLDEGIVACDARGRITVFNPSARRLHGLPDGAEPVEIPTDQGLRRADGSAMAPREHPLIRAMSGERIRDVEVLLESRTGERRKVSVNGQALVDDDGWMLGAVVAMHDVTEQRLNEERLAELALHDPLTSLANRTLLAARLRAAVARMTERFEVGRGRSGTEPAGTSADQPGLAVLLLDLDDFKEINDRLGHDVGDDTLVAVARRLTSLVRPADTVARLGGDEFVVVCEIEDGEDEMLSITDRISTELARPYLVGGRALTVTASVGGIFVDNPDTDPSKLLSRADDAMYGVKWARRRQRRPSPG